MKSMKSLTWIVGAILVLGLAAFTVAQAADEAKAPEAKGHLFVGSAKCKMCHAGPTKGEIYEVWQKSAHSTAFAKLPDASKKDAKCFPCHTTGFGKPSGYDPAAPTAATLEGVGCESCHGPGKDYMPMATMKDPAKAKAAGLVTPDATTCKGCHEGTTPEGHKALPKFDYATMYPKIEHHVAKK
jgi:hypothetical protein